MKNIVIEVTHAPYQAEDRARIGLGLAMGLSAFEHQVSVILAGDGLRNLQDIVNPPADAYHKTFAALPLYDITLYINAAEAIKNNLTGTLLSEAIQSSHQELAALKQQADILLCP